MSSATTAADSTTPSPPLTTGDIVVDRERPTNGRAVVLNTPPKTAAEWRVPGRGLVADDNPTYPRDDDIVLVAWEDDYREAFPLYTGTWYLHVERIKASSAHFYAFPESRLRRVGAVGRTRIPIDRITPSPYHARSFDAEANAEYIDKIEYHGSPKSAPFVRTLPDGRVELINGHKRTWAAHVAGLDALWCEVTYMPDRVAAVAWTQRHLAEYSDAEQRVALGRLRERFAEETVVEICDAADVDARAIGGG